MIKKFMNFLLTQMWLCLGILLFPNFYSILCKIITGKWITIGELINLSIKQQVYEATCNLVVFSCLGFVCGILVLINCFKFMFENFKNKNL